MAEKEPRILITGDRVLLRDRSPNDVDRFIYWQTHGEWLQYDAPWEGFGDTLTPEQESKIRSHFLDQTRKEGQVPRQGAMIALQEKGILLGTVNRYGNSRFPKVYYIGINICDNTYLNVGLGTEALTLWIDYLFENSTIHKIECHTWSINPRMIHLAEKLGFHHEGCERELIQWQGEWHDRIRYGILRDEWKNLKYQTQAKD